MRYCFYGDHRVHTRGTWEGRAIHYIEIAHFPTLSLRICNGASRRRAHPRRAHDVKREQRNLRGVPPCEIHIPNQATERASTPWLIRAPFSVRRKNQFRSGSFQNARRADKSIPEVLAVKR